jgi:pilus assembly protein FimV
MLRKLALSLAIAGALGTSNAYALGLGEIKITSALNEPLQAEIQLLQMREVDPQQIQPSMANIDDFALAGIEKLRFLSDVKFEVKPGSSGRGTILMTSSAVVKEPFLNFLVEVNWPSGRLVREYTVLLDPPVYDPTPAPVAVQPARSAATPASAPVAAKPMAPQKPANNIRTRMTDGQVYVDVNDTLWDLAKRHKPNGAITEAQMMLALQRKNPEAFSNNNVNQLKAGVVLDLPSEDEIKALSQKQANEEFWRQTQMWKQGVVNPAAPKQIDSTATEDEKKAVAGKKGEEVAAKTAEGQLKIVSPDTTAETGTVSDQAAKIDTSSADAVLLEKNKQLETELASALETVDQIKRENEELSGRVDALAQQMESLHRLVELKDQQLVDLQAELDAAKQQSAAVPVAPVPEPQPKGLLERFGLYIGAAGGALVAFLLALLLLRRGKKEEPQAEPVPEALPIVDEQPKEPEEEVAIAAEPEEIEEESDLDDLDLDLDMDLDKVDEVDEQIVDEDEFDLGFDDVIDDAPAEPIAEEVEEVEEIDDALDSILGEDTESLDLDDLDADPLADSLADLAEEEPELESLDDLLAEVEGSDDAADDIEFNVAPAEPAVEELVEDVDGLSEDELDLDFDLDMADTDAAVSDDAEDEQALGDMLAEDESDIDDLDALLAGTDEVVEAPSEQSEEESDDDFTDLEELLGQEADVSEDDIDGDLSELLAGIEESDVEEVAVSETSADVDLDPELAALLNEAVDDEVVLDEEELSPPESDSSVADDLDAELDSELEMLLSDAGSEELSLDVAEDAEDDSLEGLNLLEGADEVETKLDLARAYIDMEDFDGAKDILQEIQKEGSDAQQSEANSLLGSINS